MTSPEDEKTARWVLEVLLFDAPIADHSRTTEQRLLAEVYRRHGVEQARSRRRRRRRWGGAVGAALVVAGGAAAAAILWEGQPTRPENGATCRAEASLQSEAIVIAPTDDLLAACAARWADGVFGALDGAPPALVACIDPFGGVDVVPGDAATCQDLGLTLADPLLSDDNAAVVELQERLVDEVNAGPCRPVDEVVAAASAVLRESGLDDWTVSVAPGSDGGTCGKTAVDGPTKTVSVFSL